MSVVAAVGLYFYNASKVVSLSDVFSTNVEALTTKHDNGCDDDKEGHVKDKVYSLNEVTLGAQYYRDSISGKTGKVMLGAEWKPIYPTKAIFTYCGGSGHHCNECQTGWVIFMTEGCLTGFTLADLK